MEAGEGTVRRGGWVQWREGGEFEPLDEQRLEGDKWVPIGAARPPAGRMYSRWDPLNPTNILAVILLGWGFTVVHRPNLPNLLVSYGRFGEYAPWWLWGVSAVVIAVALLFSPRASSWRLLAHAASGTYFLMLSLAFGGAVGMASGVTTYNTLAAVSGILFARTSVHCARKLSFWSRLVNDPPPWLQWLAHVPPAQKE